MPRHTHYDYDVNALGMTQKNIDMADAKKILHTYPDLPASTIAEIRPSVIEEFLTPDRFGRARSFRELAIQFRVSLRTIVYAVNPGILRDIQLRQTTGMGLDERRDRPGPTPGSQHGRRRRGRPRGAASGGGHTAIATGGTPWK
ncbi:MAG: hypothetical protein IKE64_14905 [Thermoguttaceae bacterium]|nr:hypothetical protein [Thermoguttaceae bacterium]